MEFLGGLLGDGVYQLVGKVLAFGIYHVCPRLALGNLVADCQQQMGLPQSGAPIYKQGIICLGGVRRHCHRRCMGKLIGGANNEGREGVLVFPFLVCRDIERILPLSQLLGQSALCRKRFLVVDRALLTCLTVYLDVNRKAQHVFKPNGKLVLQLLIDQGLGKI